MTQQNEDLVSLISAIQHISLNHQDLLEVSLECSSVYFKNKKELAQQFDKFWGNSLFIDQSVLAAREGIVLAMQAITLDPHLSFLNLVNNCIDLDLQRYNETKITQNTEEQLLIKEFLCFLRKELFSRIYSQNKEMQKLSKIPKDVLSSRYDTFMQHSF